MDLVHEVRNEGEWVGILDSMRVQVSVVVAGTKFPVLFLNKEKGGRLGRLGSGDLSSSQVFLNELFTRCLLCWCQRIGFGMSWDEQVFKFDGVVIRPRGGKFGGVLLIKDVLICFVGRGENDLSLLRLLVVDSMVLQMRLTFLRGSQAAWGAISSDGRENCRQVHFCGYVSCKQSREGELTDGLEVGRVVTTIAGCCGQENTV